MAKRRSSVRKREREIEKRQRELRKTKKATDKRERRLTRDHTDSSAPSEGADVVVDQDDRGPRESAGSEEPGTTE
jgi:hypothetical protein